MRLQDPPETEGQLLTDLQHHAGDPYSYESKSPGAGQARITAIRMRHSLLATRQQFKVSIVFFLVIQ